MDILRTMKYKASMKNLGLIESTEAPLEHEIEDMKDICHGHVIDN